MSYTEHQYSSHDGLSLYYRSYGSGDEVVICLPGMSRNCKDFDDLAEHLSLRWRVICPDFRGRGQSAWDPDPTNYHPVTYAKDTWTMLDDLGIRQFVVIGTSLGGLVAMVMAQQQSDRIRAVVMNDIAPEIPPDAAARILNYMGRIPPVSDWQAAATRSRQTYEQALPGLPDEFWQSWVHKSYREDESGKIVPDMDPAIGDALRKTAASGFDTWGLFRALAMPCLLLRGALSDILTEDTAERMQAIKADLEMVTVPDRGHAPLLNENSSLQAIDSFLNRISGEIDAPAQAGECTLLRAVNITRAGAFMEWLPGQDLLVPISQLLSPMQKGKFYVVYLLLDPQQRIIGSTKLHRYLAEDAAPLKLREQVKLMIVSETDLGYKAVINGTHLGLLFKNEVFQKFQPGDRTTGYIKAIRKDRKINLGLQLPQRSAQEDLCDRILAFLKEHDGVSTITDYSPPEEIYQQFAVSKGNYKKALGVLYKKRRISVAKDKITLLKP